MSEFGPCGIAGCTDDSLLRLNGTPVCLPHFEETLAGIHDQTVRLAREELS